MRYQRALIVVTLVVVVSSVEAARTPAVRGHFEHLGTPMPPLSAEVCAITEAVSAKPSANLNPGPFGLGPW